MFRYHSKNYRRFGRKAVNTSAITLTKGNTTVTYGPGLVDDETNTILEDIEVNVNARYTINGPNGEFQMTNGRLGEETRTSSNNLSGPGGSATVDEYVDFLNDEYPDHILEMLAESFRKYEDALDGDYEVTKMVFKFTKASR